MSDEAARNGTPGQGFGANSSPWIETAFPAGSAPIDISVTWGNGHSFAASADARNSRAPGTWSVSEIPGASWPENGDVRSDYDVSPAKPYGTSEGEAVNLGPV